MSSTYEYDTLGTRGFRILRLLRAEQSDHVLKCRLEVVGLSDRPPTSYYALSYVWGSLAPSVDIEIGNKTIKITETLSRCLKRLRLTDGDVILWVDQICINQQDPDERSTQVQIMGDIYRNAVSVIAWLGDDPDGNSPILKQLLDDIHLDQNGEPDLECFVRNHLPERESPKWRALDALLRLPYFTRVWVMQEVILGRKVSFRWSEVEFDLTRLRGLVDAAHRAGEREFYGDNPIGTFGLHCAMSLTDPPESRSFESIMNYVAHRHATDPRDRIYAILGFVEDGPSIVPHYDMPVQTVFTDAAMQVISLRKNLDILSYVAHSVNHHLDPAEWPTWVPTWDGPISPMIHKFGRGYSVTNPNSFTLPALDAENRSLSIRGLLFSSIEFLGMLPEGSEVAKVMDSYAAAKVWDAWKLASGFEPTRKLYGPFFLDMFVSTLLGGWPEDDRDELKSNNSANDESFRDFASFWADVLARTVRWVQDSSEDPVPFVRERVVLADLLAARFKSEKENTLSQDSAPSVDWKSEMANDPDYADHRTSLLEKMKQKFDEPTADFVSRELAYFYPGANWHKVYSRFNQAGNTHTFFVLSDGQIGIGPLIMEKTDVVAALNGGRVPFVLRPVDGGYFFVGECYTAGCVHENLIIGQEAKMLQLR